MFLRFERPARQIAPRVAPKPRSHLVASISTNQSPAPGSDTGGSSVSGLESRRIAFDQMHRDDAVELFRDRVCRRMHGAQLVLVTGVGRRRTIAERCAAALTAADGDARDGADHVFETRQVCFDQSVGFDQRGAIGRAVQHLECRGGIEAEIFRLALMRDIAPSLEKTSIATRSSRCSRSYHRLKSASWAGSMSIDVSSIAFPASGMSAMSPYAAMLEARSAIAFITASLTPGSYSEWPAPSTIRISDIGPCGAERMRGRRRAEQIVAALHDDAREFLRACSASARSWSGLHEAVVLESNALP